MKTFLKTVLPFIFGKNIVTPLTKEEILKETVEHYSTNPKLRAVSKDTYQCLYNAENGNHCAVGRCLLPNLKEMGLEMPGNASTLEGLQIAHKAKDLDELLNPKYRGHAISFWRTLQGLHDSPNYWDEEGLNEAGKSCVERIEKGIKTNGYV